MNDFQKFSNIVNTTWTGMSKAEVFVADVDPEVLWATYLSAFPEGTNPLFRERTEHDCSCCRNFIKNIGGAVSPSLGVTVWASAAAQAPYPYNVVASALHALVSSAGISSVFRSKELRYGAEYNFEGDHKWHHFWGTVDARHYARSPDKARGDYATAVGVFRRGLDEIKPEALTTILELIDSNNLYRGQEHRGAVLGFKHLQDRYKYGGCLDSFVWQNATQASSRFRNTVIGTLAVDLSEGVDLERAVASFEVKVAPTNYKRTTALVTPAMVKEAVKKIEDLGLEPALDRRHARLSDVSVTDVLWVSGAARGAMKGGIGDVLMEGVQAKPTTSKATEISMEALLAEVLPKTKKLEVLVSNAHQSNFVSVTAPAVEGAPSLFKWDNGFAWSYDGEVADSIKERVKKAGGSVEGDLCCRLAWDYKDDLDFHMSEPGGGHISFRNRRILSKNGGMLDVDANGADGYRDDPVENIFYKDSRKMGNGSYMLSVNNYSRRSDGVGFEVEIEANGEVISLSYGGVLRTGETIEVAYIKVEKGVITHITWNGALKAGRRSTEKWGINTELFVEVDTLMLSPNYWGDNKVGNKHWFFIINGCKNPAPTRGIYNEFLRPDLEQYRKVFELVGEKTKVPVAQDQLSGLGFSSTRKDKVTVRCDGRTFNVQF